MQSVCSMKCAIDKVKKDNEKKAKDERRKADKARRDKRRDDAKKRRDAVLNDHPKQFSIAKDAVQSWVAKVRDAGQPCRSCSTRANVVYCGGHFRTAGGNPELALDTRNIHIQCNAHCNMHLSGNIEGHGKTHGYRYGLNMIYGERLIADLESYHPPVHYTCEQLRDIAAYYRKLSREGIKDDSDRPHAPAGWLPLSTYGDQDD